MYPRFTLENSHTGEKPRQLLAEEKHSSRIYCHQRRLTGVATHNGTGETDEDALRVYILKAHSYLVWTERSRRGHILAGGLFVPSYLPRPDGPGGDKDNKGRN